MIPTEKEKLDIIVERIQHIYEFLLHLEKTFQPQIDKVHEYHTASAYNLLHYIALRSFDITELQKLLARLGLSSLGRSERSVLAYIWALSKRINQISDSPVLNIRKPRISFSQGQSLLESSTIHLLGLKPNERRVRIMVTMPSLAAEDYEMVKQMVKEGMNIARVNCAHDNQEVWLKMVENIRKASRELNIECKVLMDLAGPKLRTSQLEPGPKILSWRPNRDQTGDVVSPALLWLSTPNSPPPLDAEEDGTIPVGEEWLKGLKIGDVIRFKDRRGKKRKLKVIQIEGTGVWATGTETAYIEPGIVLKNYRDNKFLEAYTITSLPFTERPIILKVGDILIVDKDIELGKTAEVDKKGNLISPAVIGCPLPEVYTSVKKGETVRIDDGKIEGTVEYISPSQFHLRITQAKENGSKLKAEKGLNFPDSNLKLNGLTRKDIKDLDFVAQHADIVSLSFVQEPEDILHLQKELKIRGAENLGIVLKIETQKGFQNLTKLLLTVMQSKVAGVMIARGDLAVEYGWARMAEIQEEILWLCEAAHIPVIWATQVLEGLAKKGLPSRAEITDAAMAQRAECVMLNKGPYILKAINMLNEILSAMEKNQNKKTALLRKLSVAADIMEDEEVNEL